MRKNEDIIKQYQTESTSLKADLKLEVLLNIRDILLTQSAQLDEINKKLQ